MYRFSSGSYIFAGMVLPSLRCDKFSLRSRLGLGYHNVRTCSGNCAVCDYLSYDGSIWPLEEGLKLIFLVTVLWMLVMVAVL
jgi:hypothetical protein